MAKESNFRVDRCLFTNHALRRPVMLRGATSLRPLAKHLNACPTKTPRSHQPTRLIPPRPEKALFTQQK